MSKEEVKAGFSYSKPSLLSILPLSLINTNNLLHLLAKHNFIKDIISLDPIDSTQGLVENDAAISQWEHRNPRKCGNASQVPKLTAAEPAFEPSLLIPNMCSTYHLRV